MVVFPSITIAVTAILLSLGSVVTAPPARAAVKDEIRDLLTAEREAWNQGKIDDFMQGYWRDEKTRYASCSTAIYGWDKIREHYGSPHGMLTLDVIDVDELAPDVAAAFLRWSLQDGKIERGLSSLVLRKMSGAWRIIADHTSSAGADCAVAREPGGIRISRYHGRNDPRPKFNHRPQP